MAPSSVGAARREICCNRAISQYAISAKTARRFDQTGLLRINHEQAQVFKLFGQDARRMTLDMKLCKYGFKIRSAQGPGLTRAQGQLQF